jgi:hypothetical protein
MAESIVRLEELAAAQKAADAAVEAAMLAAQKVAELAEPKRDRTVAFNTRLRVSTIAAIDARARKEDATLKQIICRGLLAIGLEIAAADLDDGTSSRDGHVDGT